MKSESSSLPLTSPIKDARLKTDTIIVANIIGTAANPEKNGHNKNAKNTLVRG